MGLNKQVIFAIILLFLFNCNETIRDNNKNYIADSEKVFCRTEGKQIFDLANNSIRLKGTNVGNWLVPEGYMFKMNQINSPRKIDELLHELIGPDSLQAFWNAYLDSYITHEDIKYLKAIGCNHIRLPFHYRLFTNDLYMGNRNVGFKYFDKIINWCKQEELYILLDMHCAPGGQTGDNIDDSYGYPYLLFSESSQKLFREIWVKIAQRYHDENIIIGYDLLNEPVAHYFTDEIKDYNQRLHLIYKQTINEIRKVDNNHIIFLNGSVWSGDFGVFNKLFGENIVYEFHKYWFDVKQEAIREYVDFRDNNEVPIYIGETGENSDEWVEEFRILLDENKIPWCFWPYKKMNNTAGIMNFEEPETYKSIKDYALSDRSSYKKMRENRPVMSEVQQALNQFIINCKFENCFPNEGYVEALSFKMVPEKN